MFNLGAVLCLTTIFFISGCVNTQFGRADIAARGKVELVGKSKMDVLMCAGAPASYQKVDDMEFMTYLSGGDSDAYLAGGGRSSLAGGLVSVKKRYCEVTFILNGGFVDKVSYAGRTGGLITKDEQCAFALENCLVGQH